MSTPYWRWWREIARQESCALRAYARHGLPAPPYQAPNPLEDYNPRRKISSVRYGPDTPLRHQDGRTR